MVVDHSHSLHEGIADGRSDELEPPFLEVPAHGFSLRCSYGYLSKTSACVADLLSPHESPEVRVQRTELLLGFQDQPGIGYGGLDL